MGRALFSASRAATAVEPAIKTQPESQLDTFEKWSVWNRFDPDSDDFFQDAEYEAFIDPVQLEQQRLSPLGGSPTISDVGTMESSESDQHERNVMAVGSDDPAILIRGSYNPVTRTWDATIDPTASDVPVWISGDISPPYASSSGSSSAASSPAQSPRLSQNSDQLGNPPFIPPASFRAPSPGEQLSDATQPFRTSRHSLSPISITVGPINTPRRQDSYTMVTPSPPPSVTPRVYSWQNHPFPAIPTSPTVIRGNSDGPLTNPRARMSYTRIETTPARVRVSNIAM